MTAARAAFAERGFDGTTLSAIAGRIGLSAAALLRHAPTKEALFAAAMSTGPGDIQLPFDFLAGVEGTTDPRLVLRRIGELFVPFIEQKLDEQVARWMRAKAGEEAHHGPVGPGGIPLPFDPAVRPTPPQRAVSLIEDWLRRAQKAGRVRLADPTAAALLLLASLHSYVALHRIVKVFDPPLPLDRYLDTLLEIWTHGVVTAPRGKPIRSARS